jgi:hypothetical protein
MFLKNEFINSSLIQTNGSSLTNNLNKAAAIVGIRVISGIGIVFNIITLIVLFNKKYKHKFYDFLRCRCISYLVVCIYGVLFKNFTETNEVDDYLYILVDWFVIFLPIRITFLASAITDILLVLNRFVNLCDRKTIIFYTLSKKVSAIDLNQK